MVLIGGEIDGRLVTLGKLIDEGDGNIADRVGCGACNGDCDARKVDPDEDAVC